MFWETGWTDKKALVGLILHECSYSFNFFFRFVNVLLGKERSVFRTGLWWTPGR